MSDERRIEDLTTEMWICGRCGYREEITEAEKGYSYHHPPNCPKCKAVMKKVMVVK